MRASLPVLILGLSLASPAFAADAAATPGRADVRSTATAALEVSARSIAAARPGQAASGPKLAYADLDRSEGGAPRLAYAVVLPSDDDVTRIAAPVWAASAILPGTAAPGGNRQFVTVRNGDPADHELAALVTIALTPPPPAAPPPAAPTPVRAPALLPAPAPSPSPAPQP